MPPFFVLCLVQLGTCDLTVVGEDIISPQTTNASQRSAIPQMALSTDNPAITTVIWPPDRLSESIARGSVYE